MGTYTVNILCTPNAPLANKIKRNAGEEHKTKTIVLMFFLIVSVV